MPENVFYWWHQQINSSHYIVKAKKQLSNVSNFTSSNCSMPKEWLNSLDLTHEHQMWRVQNFLDNFFWVQPQRFLAWQNELFAPAVMPWTDHFVMQYNFFWVGSNLVVVFFYLKLDQKWIIISYTISVRESKLVHCGSGCMQDYNPIHRFEG